MTEIMPTAPAQKGFAEKGQLLWVVFPPTPLVYTICTVIFGNGAPTLGIKIIIVRRLMAVFGSLGEIRNTGWCAVVRASTIPGFVAVPIVTSTCRTVGSGSADFVLFPSRLRGLFSPLPFIPFVLCPSFLFPVFVASGNSIFFSDGVTSPPTPPE